MKNPRDVYDEALDFFDGSDLLKERVKIGVWGELFEIRHELSELNTTLKEIRDFLKPKNC